MEGKLSRTSRRVSTRPLNPFMRVLKRAATASNHPHRRARPVVAPNSWGYLADSSLRSRRAVPSASARAPTLVVYALTTPKT